MLSSAEKTYIEEKYVNWKPGKFRYWQALPVADLNNPQSEKLAEESQKYPALVLLHGYAASIEHWRRAFAGLKGRYRIYALDLLGFGQSEKLTGSEVQYTSKLWAKQVYDFLRYKGEEKVVIAGHSMGGMVTIQFAIDYPEMLAGMILVDAAGLPDQGNAETEAAQARNRRRNFIDFGRLTFEAIRMPVIGELAATIMANPVAVRQGLIQAYWKPEKVTPQLVEQFVSPLRTSKAALAYLAISRNFASFQLPIKPGQFDHVPTLIIWGEHDRSMPPKIMLPRWQKLFPEADTELILDAAHCPQDERPDLVNPAIMRFMEKLQDAGEKKQA
jgi:pimeloyl-ACP methyl ester carboxylesterase